MQRARVTKPILIRDAVVVTLEEDEKVVAKLRKKYEDRAVISIPPEMAFGTGDHPTTATCLRFLVDVARAQAGNEGKSWDLLDLGTGSGVLAIAGKLLGAGEVRAVDYDEKAVEVCERNILRNLSSPSLKLRRECCEPSAVSQQKTITAEQGDVFEMTSRKTYEVVVANLFSDTLIAAFPRMVKWIKKGGTMIVSGILADQWAKVEEAGEREGLSLLRFVKKGKWVTAEFLKG